MGYKPIFVVFGFIVFWGEYVGNVIWFGWGFNFHHLLKSVFVSSSKINSVVFF